MSAARIALCVDAPPRGQRSLLAQARGGNPEAFAEMVSPYMATLYRRARGLTGNAADAQDVSQEAVLRREAVLEEGRRQRAGNIRCGCKTEVVPRAPPAARKTAGLTTACGGSRQHAGSRAPGLPPPAGKRIRYIGWAGVRQRRLTRLIDQSYGLGFFASHYLGVIRRGFLALTCTVRGATKSAKTCPLVVSLLPHCGDITRVRNQTCLAGQACFAAEGMSATPHHPGR